MPVIFLLENGEAVGQYGYRDMVEKELIEFMTDR